MGFGAGGMHSQQQHWLHQLTSEWMKARLHAPYYSSPHYSVVFDPAMPPGLQMVLGQEQDLQTKIAADLYEHLLLQSLAPAFDDIPLKRVFPFFLYTPTELSDLDRQLGAGLLQVIAASGCNLVYVHPTLHGSKLARASLQTPTRQTRPEFAAVEAQLVNDIRAAQPGWGNVTVNLYPPRWEPEPKDWAGRLKDVTEALKNILLIGAGVYILFGGVVMSSHPDEHAGQPRSQMSREHQLKALPKILEANSAEEFLEVIRPEQAPPSSNAKSPNVPPSSHTGK